MGGPRLEGTNAIIRGSSDNNNIIIIVNNNNNNRSSSSNNNNNLFGGVQLLLNLCRWGGTKFSEG